VSEALLQRRKTLWSEPHVRLALLWLCEVAFAPNRDQAHGGTIHPIIGSIATTARNGLETPPAAAQPLHPRGAFGGEIWPSPSPKQPTQRFLAALLAVTGTVAVARNVRRTNGAATVITEAAGITAWRPRW
jgi:hypothetical protein